MIKYNVGDRVLIKSLDWYNDNKDEHGYVPCREYDFVPEMLDFCGKILTIDVDFEDETYLMKEDIDGFVFTSEMIERLVERNGKIYRYNIGDRVVLKDNRRATITDLKYNSFGNLSYYIKIDNDSDVSVDIYDNMIEGLAKEECPQDFIEEYCKSCGTQRCDRTKEYLDGCPCYNAYMCKKQNNTVKDDMSLDKAGQITDFEYEGLAYTLPDGYQFVDENGNEILTSKIILKKKKEIIPNLQLDSTRTVREYDTVHSRIWLEIYEDNPKLCIFTHLLVDEDHRHKGYGTKALEQAEIIAKDLGCDTIHLKVETHSWMHEWYLRLGYKFLTNAENNYTWLTKSI